MSSDQTATQHPASDAARADILSRLRRQIAFPRPLPDVLQGAWIEYPDPLDKFASMVASVGGQCHVLNHPDELPQRLPELAPWKDAKRIFSAIDQVPGNVDLEEVDDPHRLDDLDFVVYPGQFG
ncbi:MAG: hypothetical protein D6753_08900, partial [Planctomycetota bacterium]